jgi:hypothetical protein
MTTYEANEDFPFGEMSLGQPQAMQGGGSWFTKLSINNSPILVQLPKCNMKNGIVKTKRVTYSDLMYSSTKYEQVLSNWVESLEESCQNLIDKKKHLWFSNEITRDDLETMMTSLIRLYKSGTKALMRAFFDVSRRSGNLKCHIYDENERIVDSDNIKNTSAVIPLVQIEGIKFTSRSFDIEIKIVQLMVLEEAEEEVSFTKSCMIKRDKLGQEKLTLEKTLEDNKSETTNSSSNSDSILETTEDENKKSENIVLEIKNDDENTLENTENNDDIESSVDKEASNLGNTELKEVSISLDNLDDAIVESQDSNSEESMSSLTDTHEPDLEEISVEVKEEISPKIQEIVLDVKDNENVMTLKKPNEVYYEIYRAAREKAKHMRKVALEAYLEAKQIKTKYMLEDLDESDEEFDFTENEVSGLTSV